MRLSKIVIVVGALCVASMSAACHRVTPDAGEQAVLIRQPWFFGHGGVVSEPVTTGTAYTALSTKSVMINMLPIQSEEKFDDLMSADGIPLSFDSTMRWRVTDPVLLVSKFGVDVYANNIQSEFRNRVRQAVRKHGMNETAISTTAIDTIDAEVTEQMLAYIKASGLPIQLVKITVGKANPPDAIRDQRIKTAQEQQRQITEGQTQLAEESRKAAETARAAADNAYRLSLGLSPQEYVELKRIEMQHDVCVTKGGACTFIMGNATPVISTR